MDDESEALERVRSLAGWLNIPVADDDTATITRIFRTHDRERGVLRDAVTLNEEPEHTFVPMRRGTSGEAQG